MALPNPDTMTRQPGSPSAGEVTTIEFDEPISPEEALAEAKAQKEAVERERDAARTHAQALQRERDEALSRATQESSRASANEEQTLATLIAAHTTAIDQAKIAYANARAAGDAVAEAEALDQLADARATLRDLNGRKAYVEQQKNAPRPQARPDGFSVQTPNGTMNGVSPAAKEWMDENPRFYSDKAFYNHAVAGHSSIIADGIQEGSPAYFRALTDHMKQYEEFEAFKRGDTREQPQVTDSAPRPQARPRMSAAATGAPVSRSSAPTTRNAPIDANTIAKRQGVEVDDLRNFARINGYTAARYGGDEAKAFNAYLQELHNISEIERSGGDTGMKVDGAWR